MHATQLRIKEKHESGKKTKRTETWSRQALEMYKELEWEAKWMKANRAKDEQIIMYIYRGDENEWSIL